MISRTVEYALRAAVWLASRRESPQTTRQIAEATQVPTSYLSKVLQALVDEGLLTSQRGLGGGFTLARDPAKLTVLDVVNAVEPVQRIRTCPLRLASHSLRLCALHQRIDDALATVERAFASTNLAELTEDRAEPPLCPSPGQTTWTAGAGALSSGDSRDAARAASGRRPDRAAASARAKIKDTGRSHTK